MNTVDMDRIFTVLDIYHNGEMNEGRMFHLYDLIYDDVDFVGRSDDDGEFKLPINLFETADTLRHSKLDYIALYVNKDSRDHSKGDCIGTIRWMGYDDQVYVDSWKLDYWRN